MALQFPSSPTNGQIYYDTTSGNRYIYDSATTSWKYAANNDPVTTSSNTQIIYNNNGGVIGSSGLTFSSNTLYTNTINVSQNVNAQYYFGNGASLTGIVNDFSPAFNQANAAFDKANNALANTSNVVFAGDLRVTGNVFVGTSTVTITNNSITATSITVTDLFVNGSAVPSGAVSNLAFDTANAAFGQSNTLATSANAYADVVGTSSNNYLGSLVNSASAIAVGAFDKANAVATGANAYATAVGTAGNTYAAAVGTNANNYSNATFVKLTAASQTITGDFSITGNLIIGGNTTTISANNLVVNDSLIYLANNNTSDILDIGFIGSYYNATSAHVHTGLYREHASKQYYLFQGFDANPELINDIVPYANNMVNATLIADFLTSNLTLGGANAITWITSGFGVANAAYGQANTLATSANAYAAAVGVSANAYAVTVGTSGNAFATSIGTAGNAYAVTVGTSGNNYAATVGTSSNNYAGVMANSVNAYTSATYSTLTQFGSVFGVANGAFGAANGKVASVTGTAGQIFSSGGTAPTLNLISSGVTATTYGGATFIPVLAVDSFGRITSASNVAVQGMDYAYTNTVWGVANAGYTVANAAFGVANTALQNTSGVSFAGTLYIPGDLGIGTTSPAGKIHASGDIISETSIGASQGAYYYQTRKSRGTIGTPASVTLNDHLGGMMFGGHDGTGWYFPGMIQGAVDGAVSTGVVPVTLRFWTGTNSSPSERMRITSSGNVGIGTMTPSRKFEVVGDANISLPTLIVAGQNVLSSIISGNTYAGAMANSVNAYTSATYSTLTQFGSVFGVANAAFGVANNAYTATNGAAAFAFANGVATNTTAAFAFANGVATNATAAFAAANAEFTFSNTIYAAVNSAFAVINAAYTSSNADYVVSNAAFTAANSKVASVTGTAGQIYSSGGTAPTLNLISSGVTATTYGGATYIPVIVVDAFGRITSAANQSFSAGGVTSVSGTAGRVSSTGGTTPVIDLVTAGAGAATYSSGISAITVDAYGRVTAVTGSAGYLTGITSGQVTTALGYTPYNSTNPSGYITSSALTPYAPLAGATFTGLITGRVPTTSGVGVGNDAGSMSIRGDTTKSAHVSFHRAGAYAINMGLDTDNVFRFGGWSDGSTTYRLQLAAPGGSHAFNGSITATSNITAYFSDLRLKTDITLITDAIEKIKQISGVTYRSNNVAAKYGYTDQSWQVGVIAQEIKKVLPEAVKPAPFDTEYVDGKERSISGENYMTVQYEKIIPLLIEAIKEQQEKIEKLESKIDSYQQKN